MKENDYIAEYVKERHPNILGADYGLWKTGRMIANIGKGIISASEAMAKIKEYEEKQNQTENIRVCLTCKNSDDGRIADTETCHKCMWNNQYEPKQIEKSCDTCEHLYVDKCGTERCNGKLCVDYNEWMPKTGQGNN